MALAKQEMFELRWDRCNAAACKSCSRRKLARWIQHKSISTKAGATSLVKPSLECSRRYAGDEEGKGGIFNFVTKRGICLGENSKISWTQVWSLHLIYCILVYTAQSLRWELPSVRCAAWYQRTLPVLCRVAELQACLLPLVGTLHSHGC